MGHLQDLLSRVLADLLRVVKAMRAWTFSTN
jgi:hypothetical protein